MTEVKLYGFVYRYVDNAERYMPGSANYKFYQPPRGWMVVREDENYFPGHPTNMPPGPDEEDPRRTLVCEIDGSPVIGIGPSAFRGKQLYDYIVRSRGFTEDERTGAKPTENRNGQSAYFGMFGMGSTESNFMKNIIFIAERAFQEASGVVDFTFSDENTPSLQYIGESAFESADMQIGFTYLPRYGGGRKMFYIGENAFKGITRSFGSLFLKLDTDNADFNIIKRNAFNFELQNIDLKGFGHVENLGIIGPTEVRMEDCRGLHDTFDGLHVNRFEYYADFGSIRTFSNVLHQKQTLFTRNAFNFSNRDMEKFSFILVGDTRSDYQQTYIGGELVFPSNKNIKEQRIHIYNNVEAPYISGGNANKTESNRIAFADGNFNFVNAFNEINYLDSLELNANIVSLEDSFNYITSTYQDKGIINSPYTKFSKIINSFNGIDRIADPEFILTSPNTPEYYRNSFTGIQGYDKVEAKKLIEANPNWSNYYDIISGDNARVSLEVGDLEDNYIGAYDPYGANMSFYAGREEGVNNFIIAQNKLCDKNKSADRIYTMGKRFSPIHNPHWRLKYKISIPGEWELNNTRFAFLNREFLFTTKANDGADTVHKLNMDTGLYVGTLGLAAPKIRDFGMFTSQGRFYMSGGVVPTEPNYNKTFMYSNGTWSRIKNAFAINKPAYQAFPYKGGNLFRHGHTVLDMPTDHAQGLVTQLPAVREGQKGELLGSFNKRFVAWYNSTTGILSVGGRSLATDRTVPPMTLRYPDASEKGYMGVLVDHCVLILAESGKLILFNLKEQNHKILPHTMSTFGLKQMFSYDGFVYFQYEDHIEFEDVYTLGIRSNSWGVSKPQTKSAYSKKLYIVKDGEAIIAFRKDGQDLYIYDLFNTAFK